MESKIKKIITDNYADGVFHTHVSLFKPKGKFQLDKQSIERFWEEYCGNIDKVSFGLAEKPQQFLPVLVDIDLRVRDTGDDYGESLYTPEQLLTVVSTYQSVLRKVLDNCTEEDLTCVVLEKDMYQQTKNEITYFKHGFHLHFPVFIDKIEQELHIIPRVQNELKELKLFENLGIQDSGSVVDKQCCKVPWLVYGCKKSEEAQPYKVTKVLNADLKEISLEKAFRHYQIFDAQDSVIPLKGNVEKYLPRILSILPYNRTTKTLKRGLISPLKERIKKEKKTSTVQKELSLEEAVNTAKELLPMLSEFRAVDRNEWMTIGWILYNITDGQPEGLELWCDFSSQCDEKYDEGECIYRWERMVKGDFTLGTLKYYASVDSPEEYKKYKERNSTKHIIASLEGSHNDVAKALFEEYGEQFVCASITQKVWFQFVGHTWTQIEDGVFLREKISGKLVTKYVEAVKEMYTEIGACNDKAKEATLQQRIKQISKMICNLKNANYKNSVMREACEVFYNPKFRDKLDTDPFLIAFKNGVYDLRLNILRPGKPEDYLSNSMNINYNTYSEDDEIVQDVHTFLEQIFPDKSVRKYFLDVASDVFVGGNHEKIVLFWTGEGDNGKSVTETLFEHMLGKLAIKMDTNVITGKKTSPGSAFADLARTGSGVRWVVLEEPDGDEAINIGILKHLSGNDKFYARDLFEKGKDVREITPLFKLIFIANKLPRIKHADPALWNRVRVIPFESTFCRDPEDVPESYAEQLQQKKFPRDKHFGKKIPRLAEGFAWVLLEHRKTNTTRIEPEKVRYASEMYRKQNDTYRQFTSEKLFEEEKGEQKSIMSLTELYSMYKTWMRESLPNHGMPDKNEVEEYFTKIWGTPGPGKKWVGYRERTVKDDIIAGNVVVVGEEDLDRGDVDEDGLPM